MKFYFFVYRFADVFGLDLADVKTFLDEIPKVPKSAFDDLKNAELGDMESDFCSGFRQRFKVHPLTTVPSSGLHTTFLPLFVQPSSDPYFFDCLREKKVKLENAYMSGISTIKGIGKGNKKIFLTTR